ncbi:MAG: hypothetical protein SQA66_12060 [Candidatus Fervidibacter sacchari]
MCDSRQKFGRVVPFVRLSFKRITAVRGKPRRSLCLFIAVLTSRQSPVGIRCRFRLGKTSPSHLLSRTLHICCNEALNFVRGKLKATERDEG